MNIGVNYNEVIVVSIDEQYIAIWMHVKMFEPHGAADRNII